MASNSSDTKVKKTYTVTVLERLERLFVVKATDEEEAKYAVEGMFYDEAASTQCLHWAIDRVEEAPPPAPSLMDHDTATVIREATAEELAASIEAAKHDGGVGVIAVDGRRCYVIE